MATKKFTYEGSSFILKFFWFFFYLIPSYITVYWLFIPFCLYIFAINSHTDVLDQDVIISTLTTYLVIKGILLLVRCLLQLIQWFDRGSINGSIFK